MFDSLKRKLGMKEKEEILYAPMIGRTVSLFDVKDPTFNQEMLGKGVAMIPTEGEVVAPVNGVIEMVFDTKHAISITSDTGIQILIHVGIDTVSLKGAHFKAYVRSGQHVRKGDLLLEFNIDTIKKSGLDPITPIVICNSYAYEKISACIGKNVNTNDKILVLKKGK